MIVIIEKFVRTFFSRVFYKLSRYAKALSFNRIANILNKAAKNTDLYLYDEESFLSYVKMKSDGINAKLYDLETLVLRGSTSDYGFQPDFFPKSYNLGLTSSDLRLTYYQYIKVSQKAKNLKNIIIYASMSMVGYSLLHTNEKNRLIAYYTFFNLPLNDIKKHFKRRHINFVQKSISKLPDIAIPPSYNGFEAKKLFITDNNALTKRIRTHYRENQREPNQLEWLLKIDSETLLNKQKLFIILCPFREDYISKMPSKKEAYKKLYALNLRNSNIIDLQDNKKFNISDFGDTDHLNEKGAIKLTKELYKIIAPPYAPTLSQT